jgi:hypothetical protein
MVTVKLFLYVIKHHTMKTFSGVETELPVFLTPALRRGEWLILRPRVSPRAGLDAVGTEEYLVPSGNRSMMSP